MKHTNNNLGVLLVTKFFTLDDQFNFAKFSGDFNPLHIDPLAARRTLVGECVVHGIHGLMWSFNELAKKNNLTIKSFEANFIKPITLNSPIQIFWNSDEYKINLISNDILLTKISVEIGDITINENIALEKKKSLTFPKEMTISDCNKHYKKKIYYRGNVEFGEILFPYLIKFYGIGNVAELAINSEIVGMHNPGLYSLFLGIKGEFEIFHKEPSFLVQSCDFRLGIIKIIIRGKCLKSEIEALYSPTTNKTSDIKILKNYVNLNEFQNINALIIGGSRGLGELTAKILSSGNGKVTITYNVGINEAKNLQKEIQKHGSICEIKKLSINKSFVLPANNFNQIYYFATPKIKSEYSNATDYNLYELYKSFYVNGFNSVIKQSLQQNNTIKLFYPSTTLITNPSKFFHLYTKTKLEGEILCKSFFDNKRIKIICPRIPKMNTDQNLSLIPESSQNSVNIMLPLIRSMCND